MAYPLTMPLPGTLDAFQLRSVARRDGRLRRCWWRGRLRRRRRRRRRDRRAAQRRRPRADRGGVLGDDVGQMQVVQRRVLERVALMIGWNGDDDRSADLAD